MKTVLLPSLLAGRYVALACMIATPVFAQNSQRAQSSAIPRSDNVAPTSTATPGTDYSRYKPVTYDTESSASDSITSQKPTGLPSITASQTPRKPYNGPALEAGGMRFFFNAPVAAPYNASSTYTTYAGQPGGGWDSTGQQGAAGEP